MKKLIAHLLAFVMVFSLTACTTKTETATDAAPVQTEAKQEVPIEEHENVSIEVMIVQTDWSDAWDEMEGRFEEQYPWINVENVGLGEAVDDFAAARAAAENLPSIIQIDQKDLYRNLVDEGKIADASKYDCAANIPQAYLDAFVYNDIVMGLTQGAAYSVMYYNMDLLKAAGWDAQPTNWDEFIQCCEDIQATGVAPLTIAGAKTTTIWMLYELILANTIGDTVGAEAYQEAFKNGKFDFTAYPEVTEKLNQISKYFLEGSATMSEDDVTAAMTDGLAAMAIGGNWTATTCLSGMEENYEATAGLVPFNAVGAPTWGSASPETAFGVTIDPNRTEAEQEAVDIFYNWVFQPENFMLIQNARGTIPVLTTMTEDQIVLPAQIAAIISDLTSAPFVKMGFNLWTVEFKEAACTALCDVVAGNGTAEDAVNTMWAITQTSYYNQ